MQHGLVASRGRGQRFKEQQGAPTHREPGPRKAGVGPAAEQGRSGRGRGRRRQQRAECGGDRLYENDRISVVTAKAMAARQSGQFKGSGVGGRLIITLAVNI